MTTVNVERKQVDVFLRETFMHTRCSWCLIFALWYGRQGTNFKFHMVTQQVAQFSSISFTACSQQLVSFKRGEIEFLWSTFSSATLHFCTQTKRKEKPSQRRSFAIFQFSFIAHFGWILLHSSMPYLNFSCLAKGNLKCKWCCWLIWKMQWSSYIWVNHCWSLELPY